MVSKYHLDISIIVHFKQNSNKNILDLHINFIKNFINFCMIFKKNGKHKDTKQKGVE